MIRACVCLCPCRLWSLWGSAKSADAPLATPEPSPKDLSLSRGSARRELSSRPQRAAKAKKGARVKLDRLGRQPANGPTSGALSAAFNQVTAPTAEVANAACATHTQRVHGQLVGAPISTLQKQRRSRRRGTSPEKTGPTSRRRTSSGAPRSRAKVRKTLSARTT